MKEDQSQMVVLAVVVGVIVVAVLVSLFGAAGRYTPGGDGPCSNYSCSH